MSLPLRLLNFDWHWVESELAPDPAAPHLSVPVDDADGWLRYPDHNWVYDKLKIARLQGLAAAPHGISPDHYPVFSKPIMNLHGMGAGSVRLDNADDYEMYYQPGHMWMELLDGRHVSTDLAVENGVPCWWRHATGLPAGGGMFDYWTITAEPEAAIESTTTEFITRHLAGFTGMINLETIGARIIEMHLRITDQWPDAYGGLAWVAALKRLHAAGRWEFHEDDRRVAYSVALFGAPDGRYHHPSSTLIEKLRGVAGVASVQTTFRQDKPNSWHANPPGGFRLAVINGFDLAACKDVRRRLAAFHGLDQIINETGA